MSSPNAAPEDLELVREFADTLDVYAGVDHLASHEALGAWAVRVGLDMDAEAVDLQRLTVFRDALRRVLAGHHDGQVDPEAEAVLAEVARSTPLIVHPPQWALAPAEEGDLVARILVAVSEAASGGELERLKICPADDCAVTFYDRSRNRSRTWCAMEVCGSRAKARAYRQRRQEQPR